MKAESKQFLQELTNTISPSGYETAASKLWRTRTENFTDQVYGDIHGNSISVLNPDKKVKIMLAGHIDEIGYMIKYIDENGFIYFSLIGGIDLHLLPGQRVWINSKKGIINGVIGKKPIHLLEADERKKVSKLEDLWIDIGVSNYEEAISLVDIGDCIVPAVSFDELNNDFIVSRGLDDKAGAFIVSETMRLLAQEQLNSTVYGVATVQEEIGLRGAITSSYNINPLVAVAIDVTFATDYPGMNKKQGGDLKLGQGPVIARGPNINPKIFEMLVECAKTANIPYQIQGISRATGTDANAIQLSKGGVATGLLGIPLRYMHTPVEVANINDLNNTAKLLKEFVLKINNESQFVL